MSSSFPKQIIGSFEDIGKDIITEVVKLPKDVTGKALESLGASGGVKSGQASKTTQFVGQADATPKANDAFDKFGDHENDNRIRQAIARSALEALTLRPVKSAPTVFEEQQKEAEQKKELNNMKKDQAAKMSLPTITPKKARGDLYGIAAKKQGSEIGKNVKHD